MHNNNKGNELEYDYHLGYSVNCTRKNITIPKFLRTHLRDARIQGKEITTHHIESCAKYLNPTLDISYLKE